MIVSSLHFSHFCQLHFGSHLSLLPLVTSRPEVLEQWPRLRPLPCRRARRQFVRSPSASRECRRRTLKPAKTRARPSTSARTPLACARCATSFRARRTRSCSRRCATERSSTPTLRRASRRPSRIGRSRTARRTSRTGSSRRRVSPPRSTTHFSSFDDGQPMEAFGASQLIQSEPDASILPVGRTSRDVGSARLHRVESGEPGVHRPRWAA